MEVIKLTAEVNKIEDRKIIQEMKQTKNWFFEEINKIDRLFERMAWTYRYYQM